MAEEPTVAELLLSGIAFGESPRWHDGRLWFADWGAQEIVAVDPDGKSEVMVRVDFPSFPLSFDWLPDGRLLLVSARDGRLLRREPDGSLVTHAELSRVAGHGHPWNEIVVDGRGNAYINNIGFDFPGGEFAPGMLALLAPDGPARQVADGIAFPNGMAVTADNSTLIVAESYASKLTAFDIGRRREPREQTNLGRAPRGSSRRDLSRRRWRRVVRRRRQQALRARPRGRRGPADRHARPRLLRLHARRRRRTNAVHRRPRVGRRRAGAGR